MTKANSPQTLPIADDPPAIPRLGYRVDELAAALGVCSKTIERRIKDGTLKATRALGATIISAESVKALFPKD